MQTIQFQVEDSLYNEIIKKGINIQDEFKKTLHKMLYKKEHKIADDINQALDEVKQGKTNSIQKLFSELWYIFTLWQQAKQLSKKFDLFKSDLENFVNNFEDYHATATNIKINLFKVHKIGFI